MLPKEVIVREFILQLNFLIVILQPVREGEEVVVVFPLDGHEFGHVIPLVRSLALIAASFEPLPEVAQVGDILCQLHDFLGQ